MRSVRDRIQNWEDKSHQQLTIGHNQSSINQINSFNGRVSNRQTNVVIENRLTQMSDARNILEVMTSKNGNRNLMPNVLPPPRQSVTASQQIDNRVSYNKPKNQGDSLNPDIYEKQFLNIRGTLNLNKKGQPPVPRNTVDINYDGQILKPSMLRQLSITRNAIKSQDSQFKANIPTQQLIPQRVTQTPNTLLKSAVVKVDKGVHYRTQKLINAMFGQEGKVEIDQFGYPKNQGGLIRMTNQRSTDFVIPKFRSQTPLMQQTLQQKQFRAKSKNKKHHQNFDDL